jgi:adenylate kinase
MAPIQDASVDDLKHKVSTLEQRIAELESRLGGGQSSAPQVQDGVRMILMGPPGAGKLAAPRIAHALDEEGI